MTRKTKIEDYEFHSYAFINKHVMY